MNEQKNKIDNKNEYETRRRNDPARVKYLLIYRAELSERLKLQRKKRKRYCIQCGDQFSGNGHVKICSPECRKERKKKQKQDHDFRHSKTTKDRNCSHCGKSFYRPYGQAGSYKYCSTNCTKAAFILSNKQSKADYKAKCRSELSRPYIIETLRNIGFGRFDQEIVSLQTMKIKAMRMLSAGKATRLRRPD